MQNMKPTKYIESNSTIDSYLTTEAWCRSYFYYNKLYTKTTSISHPDKSKVVSYLLSNCKLCKNCLNKRQNRNR